MNGKSMVIKKPLMVMARNEDRTVITHIFREEGDRYESYGLLIYDLLRHVARAFQVSENEVWEWVKRERAHPTTDIVRPS